MFELIIGIIFVIVIFTLIVLADKGGIQQDLENYSEESRGY